MLQWSIVRSEQNQLELAPAPKRQTGSVTSDQARCQCFSTQTVIRFRISMHPLPPPPEKIARILFYHGQRGRKGLNETGDCCGDTWIWVKLRIYVTKWPRPRLRPNFDVRKIQCGHFHTHTAFPPPSTFSLNAISTAKKKFNTCIFKSAGLRSPRRKGKRRKGWKIWCLHKATMVRRLWKGDHGKETMVRRPWKGDW